MKYFEEEEEEKRRNVARCSIATIQSFARGKRRGEGEREEDKRGEKRNTAWVSRVSGERVQRNLAVGQTVE